MKDRISLISLNKKHHKLLWLIAQRWVEFSATKKGTASVDFDTIYKAFDCDEIQLSRLSSRLFSDGECQFYNTDGVGGLLCKPAGLTSFVNKKYLKENRRIIVTNIKDVLGISVALIAIASAIYTAIKYISVETRNKRDIEMLKKDIDTIKLKLPFPNQK